MDQIYICSPMGSGLTLFSALLFSPFILFFLSSSYSDLSSPSLLVTLVYTRLSLWPYMALLLPVFSGICIGVFTQFLTHTLPSLSPYTEYLFPYFFIPGCYLSYWPELLYTWSLAAQGYVFLLLKMGVIFLRQNIYLKYILLQPFVYLTMVCLFILYNHMTTREWALVSVVYLLL